jgi:hypothetical protein
LTEMYPRAFRRLRLFALDPYDLALSKLERNIERDRADVRFLARTVPFDLEILRERYRKELRWQLGNPESEDPRKFGWLQNDCDCLRQGELAGPAVQIGVDSARCCVTRVQSSESDGHFGIADHPEGGQTSQYKRVYR